MRRTYMSKKATANNIDRRDLFQNLDEKCTPYDAFSIQNIKQTKRELSCVGSINTLGVASSRVRKKKYVKRIIKDVGMPSGDTMSQSTNLTPDKSIHVNKTPDPFDLLLMSSPVNSKKAESQTDKVDLCFNNIRKQGKKYTRRKAGKCSKKYNGSSTDSSESEKENFNKRHDMTHNTSDIRTHKLLVEQDHNSSSKWIDDSINNIVNNLSLLHKLKRSNNTNETINKSFRINNHRLTRNSVILKSPLSSTPFKVKYRKAGESIYKFSPIVNEDNKKSSYLNKHNDNSINSLHLDEKINQSIVSTESPQNTLNLVPNYNYEPKTSNLELLPNEDINTEVMEEIALKPSQFIENVNDDVNDEIVPNIEISSCQSEIEPFLGFSPSTNVERNVPKKILFHKTLYFNDSGLKNDSVENATTEFNVSKINQSLKVKRQSNNNSALVSLNDDIEDRDKNQILEENSDDSSVSSEHSESIINNTKVDNFINAPSHFGSSTEVINENLIGTSYCQNAHNNSEPTFVQEHHNNDTTHEHDITENVYENGQYSESNVENEVNDVSSDSLSLFEDNESLYDTCTSEQSSIQHNEVNTEPVVVLERMNDSIFYRYYNIKSNESTNTSKNDDSIENSVSDFFSVRGSSCANEKTDTDLDIDEENDLFKFDTDEDNDNTRSNSDESSLSNNEEEKCISFVTTRRRNEVTNNSIISIFSNSYSSSTDCNETVLSNKKELGICDLGDCLENNNDTVIDLDKYAKKHDEVNEVQELNISTEYVPEQKSELEFITTAGEDSKSAKQSNCRNSLVLTENSASNTDCAQTNINVSRMSVVDNRPGIVLKPGKKWERSLSIFRRMTMMTDHLNQSILDEELTKTKGRKYRQSVISTIEMQDLNGSLHNESINSRRSTFVSKPSRSTIRILKDPNSSRLSLCNTTVFDDLKGFWNEECDDTIIELSKLSIADQSHEVTVLDNFHDTSNRIAAARDYVLRRCNQTDPIIFDECYPDALLKNCHKIGEGVYGEVFLWKARDGCARVLKIIPIAGNIKVNGESQKDFHEVISEIVIAMELSALRAPIAEIERHFDEGKDVEALDLHAIENATDVFNEVLAVRCVYGSYPSRLLDLWDLYDECKGSENDNPAILPVDQQYIVLELANAGQDLESYQFNNAEQAHALFLQVAYGLAVAEEAFQFEHRDLHWGNILISPTDQKYATFVIRGRAVRVARRGVRGAVIDYSLSRVALRLGCGDAAALYNDLAADDELFDALGDYQFDVYRLMRDKLGNEWKNFEPYTNILWLHYTVDKMITALRYKRTNTKIHKHYIDKLKAIKARILGYGSAAQFVLTDNEI